MLTTIDQAGRIVIPKEIRDRAGLTPGTEIEVEYTGASITIHRAVPAPKLDRVGGRIVARPSGPAEGRPPVDVAAIVEAERERWRD
ncbi:MAG: AbrB/MazE/SpoVT family DNA-binding domain-containing protein [Acidobacteria bacterium]|nr:AbrB/MazE/SpoVT family DNA-binding domain-containing protein [Acidobacteriota bacterium]